MITDFEARLIDEHSSDPEKRAELRRRVDAGEPLAYLLSEWYFWRYTFKVTPDCLIPRPDTERVVEAALEHLPKNGRFADFCTGSGCIGISILGERPDTVCTAVDISESALAIATENAHGIGVSERFCTIRADLLTNPLPDLPVLDLIVSNPPYIRTQVLAENPDLTPEPTLALDGGTDGLTFYRRIVHAFADRLSPDGCFVFEIGYDQGDALQRIARDGGYSCEIRKDYGGNDRVAILKKK